MSPTQITASALVLGELTKQAGSIQKQALFEGLGRLADSYMPSAALRRLASGGAPGSVAGSAVARSMPAHVASNPALAARWNNNFQAMNTPTVYNSPTFRQVGAEMDRDQMEGWYKQKGMTPPARYQPRTGRDYPALKPQSKELQMMLPNGERRGPAPIITRGPVSPIGDPTAPRR